MRGKLLRRVVGVRKVPLEAVLQMDLLAQFHIKLYG